MIRVIVSQRVDWLEDRKERRDSIDQNLNYWLIAAGFLPIPVPNTMLRTTWRGKPLLQHWLQEMEPNAVLLSGGNDLGQVAERDATEHYLLDYASKLLLPMLGICRGMQMINQWAGGSLKRVPGHVATRHQLIGEYTDVVNSYHQYGLKECPKNFKVIAATQEGHIEAIRHLSLPWEGWMWHPERETSFKSNDLQRLKSLFSLARDEKIKTLSSDKS